MTDSALLTCRELSFSYEEAGRPVFEHLSFSVNAGEAVLLMGPSGCGKSSLAYCLAGLYPAYAGLLTGEILVDGEALDQISIARRAGKVSILFQNPDNQFCMDRPDHEILFALENIHYQGNLEERARELLQTVGVEDVAKQPIYTLSGGTKQKLALATALATEAKLLILDEPFANLDPESCLSLAKLLRRLNAQGLTMLIVDHRPDYWRPFLSRILLMDGNGHLSEESILPGKLEEKRAEFVKRGLFLDDEWLKSQQPPTISGPEASAIRAEHLSLYHDRKAILSDLSFTVQKGCITALIGKNGVGKSTLLSAVAGVGKRKGTLEVDGRVGLVFQNPRFQFLTLSVEDEVLRTLQVVHADETLEQRKDRAEALLEEFGLLSYAGKSPYALSQGQQRRLAVLSMLAGDRPILLMDEPTYAQDEKSTRFIMELLYRRVADGLTAVLATHDLTLARHCANHIVLLEDGRLRELDHAEMDRYLEERGPQHEIAECGI